MAVCLILTVLAVSMPVALAKDGETEIWDGSIATSFASGTGTSDDPYIIETAAQLAYMVTSSPTFAQKYVKLVNDIILNDTSNWEEWETNPPENQWTLYDKYFFGNFDGGNHTIYGLYCSGYEYGGLFYSASSGTIANVTVKDSYISATTYSGGIAGSGGNFSNCYNYATVKTTGKDAHAAGISTTSGTVTNCHNYGKIIGGTYAGGISGNESSRSISTNLQYCSNHGEVSGTYAGGIIATITSAGEIAYCYNTGTVTGNDSAGGIVGRLVPLKDHTKVYSSGERVSVVIIASTIANTYNIGDVSGAYAGGIVGSVNNGVYYQYDIDFYEDASEAFISNSYNTSVVNGSSYTGQIIGYCGSYTYAKAYGTVYSKTVNFRNYIQDVYYYNPASSVQYSVGNYDNDYNATSLSKQNSLNAAAYSSFAVGEEDSAWVMSGNPDYPYPELKSNLQPHDHAYTETVNSEATCKQDGSKTMTCWCGDTYEDVITAPGHKYEEIIDPAATCTEDGLKTFTCTCGDTYTETIPATGHSHTESIQEATCTTAGLKTYTCSCGDTYTETIPASGHDIVTVTVEPTCTKDGETYSQCTVCKTVFGEKEILPASGHNHTSTVTTKATCTTAGVKTFTCGCGDTYTESIPATGHKLKLVSQANTCTSAGFEYYICDNCGNMIGDTEYLPKLGHNYKESVLIAATCTTIGEMLYDCSRCEVSYTEEIPATGHSFGEWVQTKAPTCTATGTERIDCKNCDEYETRDVAVTAHDWEADYTVDKAATCTEKGSRSIHCKDCSATKGVTAIPALGHDYKSVATAPTCTEKGYTTHTCAVCKDSYTDSEVKANGHSYNAVVTTPDCENKGYTTHTCSVCKDSYTDSFVNATGHTYKENVTAQPSCTTAGIKTFTCDCGDSYTKEIPATGHSVGDWEHSSGNTYIKKCPVCKTVIDSEDRNNYEISIKNNSGSKTVNYGEILQLTAIVPDAPEGAKVYWYVDDVKKGEGETFEVSPGEKSVKVAVKLVDSNGEVIVNYDGREVTDEQTVNVNTGFFQKLISFFKNLFRISRIVVQSFTGLQ